MFYIHDFNKIVVTDLLDSNKIPHEFSISDRYIEDFSVCNRFIVALTRDGKLYFWNWKNQLFINKALSSLREIRESAMGTKTVSTYNAKGFTQQRSLERNP